MLRAGQPPTDPCTARRDVGLGTAYERHAVYQLLESWCRGRGIRSALEGPADGVAGMPGLHLLALARQGVEVTVVHEDPQARAQIQQIYQACGLGDRLEVLSPAELGAGRRFDLVLSFNALWLVSEWRAYLASLVDHSARYLAVIVTNPGSYGARLRRLHRRAGSDAVSLPSDHEASEPAVLLAELEQHGAVRSSTYVDCPWWPDLLVPTGQTLLGWLLSRAPRLGGPTERFARPRFTYEAAEFPFGRGALPTSLRAALHRHPAFDQSRPWLRRWFGHHQAHWLERTRREV